MDAEALRKLPRSQLRKLAVENKIKGNIKSDKIIKMLANLHPLGVPLPVEKLSTSRRKKTLQLLSSKEPSLQGAKPSVSLANKLVAGSDPLTAENLQAHAAINDQLPAPNSNNELVALAHNPIHVNEFDVPRTKAPPRQPPSEKSTYTFATPDSSVADFRTYKAAKEIHVTQTVEMMAEIDAQDQSWFSEITKLRDQAAKLRAEALKIRQMVQSQRALRKRLEGVFTYWIHEQGAWSFKEIWEGHDFRTWHLNRRDLPEYLHMEIDSDEDEPSEEVKMDLDKFLGMQEEGQQTAANIPGSGHDNIKMGDMADLVRKDYPGIIPEESNWSIEPVLDSSLETAKKRRRDEEDEDEDAEDAARPSRRRRSGEPPESIAVPLADYPHAVSSPKNKGKGKMTPEEVERAYTMDQNLKRLQREQEADLLLRELQAEARKAREAIEIDHAVKEGPVSSGLLEQTSHESIPETQEEVLASGFPALSRRQAKRPPSSRSRQERVAPRRSSRASISRR